MSPMDPYREREAAFDTFLSQLQQFRGRPFPMGWAKVVNGVGLASFTNRVERALGVLSGFSSLKPSYLHAVGAIQETVAELKAILATFDRILPALPPEPHSYFDEFRAVIVAAIEWTDVWWALDENGEPIQRP